MAMATSAFVTLPILRILGGGYIGNKYCLVRVFEIYRGPVVSRSTVRSGSDLEGGEVGDAAIVCCFLDDE